MSTKRRIQATVAAGVLLGVTTLVTEQPGLPSAGVNDAIATPLAVLAAITLVVAPLVVGRWWVAAAIAGPLLALLVLQIVGAEVTLDDGTGPAFNYRTLFIVTVVTTVLLLLGSARWAFDEMRRERSPAKHQLDHPG